MRISVIVSTYNNPKWLEKVIWGYEQQTIQNFELVIADDGSIESTKDLIETFQKVSKLTIRHVWHPDDGFQKSRILNQATLLAQGDYLIFTDGDCIPRPDFVSLHATLAKRGNFLSGGYCKLPMKLSREISKEDIISGSAFNHRWLAERGRITTSSRLKMGLARPWNMIADRITSTKPTWNGCNASTFKDYILEVNGHDEEMQYGGQDREMGERLINLGLKPVQVRYRAVLIHLDHERSYKTNESIRKNISRREATKATQATWTPNGIVQGGQRNPRS